MLFRWLNYVQLELCLVWILSVYPAMHTIKRDQAGEDCGNAVYSLSRDEVNVNVIEYAYHA